MAKVVLDFVVNSEGLTKAEASLDNIGDVTDKDKRKFSELNTEIGKTGDKAKGAEKNVKGMSNELSNLQKTVTNVGRAIGVAFAVDQIIKFGKASINAFLEAELNARKLLVATGNIQANFDRLLKQSAELQAKSIFSDDDIQMAQTMALQYGLTANEVERLTPLILDFASATGQDLSSAYEKVISGLEGNTRGLKLYGIRLKEGSTQSEKLSQITEQLTSKFAGQAELLSEEGLGKIRKFQNEVGDVMEQIGETFVDIFNAAITSASSNTNIIQQYFIDRGVDAAISFSKGVRAGLQDKFIKEIEGLTTGELKKRAKVISNAIDLTSDEQTKRNLQDRLIILEQYISQAESKVKKVADRILNDKENELKILEAQNANQITLIEKRREIVSTELALLNAKAKNKQLDDKDLIRVADLQTQYKILGIQIDNLLKRDNIATSLMPRKDQLVQIKQDLKTLDAEITANMAAENKKRKAITDDFYEKQRIQAAKDREAVEREIKDKTEQLAFESISAFAEISAIAAKEEEAQLKDQLDRKVISEAEYNRQVRKLRQEQAEKEKAAKIAEITLAGILAVQNALSQAPGVPTTIPLAILAGSLSAIQLAKAIATPIPKFAKGIEMLSGSGTETSDSIMAYLSKGERVVPANINREYFPALSAIHNKRIKAKDINEFAIGGISATIDEYALARLINRNRSVTVTNLSDLAKLFQHNARRI